MIEALHEKSIIHRDIKPDNIMIDEDGYLKFTDLTSCKLIDDRTYTLVGTPHYLAPEVFLSSGYDFAADFWSLGVCLYEFLAGRLPFDGEDTLAIYKDISQKRGVLQFPDHVRDEAAKDLIRALLQYSPDDRLTSPKQIRRH